MLIAAKVDQASKENPPAGLATTQEGIHGVERTHLLIIDNNLNSYLALCQSH
jgi:hypothetical protein